MDRSEPLPFSGELIDRRDERLEAREIGWETQRELYEKIRQFSGVREVVFGLSRESLLRTESYVTERNLQGLFHGTADISALIDEKLRTHRVEPTDERSSMGPWYAQELTPVFLGNSIITSGGFAAHGGAMFELEAEAMDWSQVYECHPDMVQKCFALSLHDRKGDQAMRTYLEERIPASGLIRSSRREWHSYADIPLNRDTIKSVVLGVPDDLLSHLELMREMGLDEKPLYLFNPCAVDFFSYLLSEDRGYEKVSGLPAYAFNDGVEPEQKRKKLVDLIAMTTRDYRNSGRKVVHV